MRSLFCALPLYMAIAPVLAQQAPQVTPRDMRPDIPVVPPTVAPQPAPPTAPENAETLFVQLANIKVEDGFTILEADTEALISPVRGQRISVATFYSLAEAIEAVYRDAGFALVRVTVPPQKVNDGGTLRLVVVDGFIERIDLTAVPHLAQARVAALLQPVVGHRHLHSDTLERALTLADRTPGMTLRSTLQPGTATGGVVLVLDGQHAPVAATLAADNHLSDSLGPWQTNVQVSANQLLGLGEQVYINASSGADLPTAYRDTARRRVFGAGLIIPIGGNGLLLNPEFTTSNSMPSPQTFIPNTRSQFQRTSLRLIYPLILNRMQELTITGTFDASSQTDTLPDFAYTLDQDRLRVARIAASWSRTIDEQARLNIGGTLSKGTNGLGARTQNDAIDSGTPLSRIGANPGFVKIEINFAYDTPAPYGIRGRTSLRAQKALNGVLPGAELFSLDGEDALSGFRSGTLSDDGGVTLRQEFSRPFQLPLAKGALTMAPYVFAAGGKASTKLSASARGFSKSYGVGLRAGSGIASLALEFDRSTSSPTNLNGNQLFVKVQVQF